MISFLRTPQVAPLALLLTFLGSFSASAHAQYGFGGGYGGYGGGYGGYGAFGGMGMTIADQEHYKYMVNMEGQARYNLMNAQTEQSYNYSYLMQQQAINLELQNQQMAQQMANDQYNIYSQTKNKALKEARDSAPVIPLNSLIDTAGSVRWPAVAPSGGVHADRRKAADEAIKAEYTGYVKNGRSSTTDTLDAKQALHAYGQPALDLLRVRKDTRGHTQLLEFLNALDAALDSMATPPTKANDKEPVAGAAATK